MQAWPAPHSASLPQAGLRQIPSSQTCGDEHSELVWQTAVHTDFTHTQTPAALQSVACWQLAPASAGVCEFPWLQARKGTMAQSATNEP